VSALWAVWQHVARLVTVEPLARQHLSALYSLEFSASYHFVVSRRRRRLALRLGGFTIP